MDAAATQQSLSLPNVGLNPTFDTLGFGIPTTNDGRAWLAVGDFPAAIFAKMAYITPQSLNPTPISLTLPTDFYDGPWYAMSRDGERLIITQTAAASPEPMLYMNAADSVLRVNPAGLTFSYYFSLSETGDRVLFDNFELRDGGFNLIGAATLPTASPYSLSYYARAGLVTPDGPGGGRPRRVAPVAAPGDWPACGAGLGPRGPRPSGPPCRAVSHPVRVGGSGASASEAGYCF